MPSLSSPSSPTIGCGTGATVLRLASFTRRPLASAVSAGMMAIARQGLHIVSVEKHGTRGKDFRVFILARKPA